MSGSNEGLDSFKLPEIISKIGSPFGLGVEDIDEEFFDSGFEIQVKEGADEGCAYPLDRREITLGRRGSPGEEKKGYILFSEPSVSKIHAVLRWDDDLKKYVIYHLAEEQETVVNGRSVKKSLLNPGYEVQLGELIFEVVSIKEKQLRESTVMWEKFKAGEERGEETLDTGYKMVVVEGPDKGETFELDKNLIVIGRRRSPGDIRDTYGILLTDSKLPEELALMVWSDRERKFSIFQSEESPVTIKLYRVVDTLEGSKIIGQEYQNVLEDKDTLVAGDTVMVIHRTTTGETPDAKVDIEKELSSSTAGAVSGEIPGQTALGSFRVDYVFEILEGPDSGHKISFLSDEMTEGRVITFGSRGDVRQNEVELDDPALSNTQGYFEYSNGNLYLINESSQLDILVNNYEIGENEKIVLNSGDRIKLGNTILGFTDNRVLTALRNFQLVVIKGGEKDKDKHFPITKTMMFVGRGSACDARVFDPEVSRLHAVLTFRNGHFYIEHKSKVNPTFINGISLKKGQDRIIFPGDKIYLSGNTILQLVRTGE